MKHPEGGAGVLRRLVEDPRASAGGASALELCHYEPNATVDAVAEQSPGTGDDPLETCEAACYDCLLSYYNQRDHQHGPSQSAAASAQLGDRECALSPCASPAS